MHPFIKQSYDENIQRFGRVVQHVFPRGGDPDIGPEKFFAYTVGNSLKGIPELLIMGLDGASMQVILNTLSDIMEREGGFSDGQKVSMGEGMVSLKVIRAGEAARSHYTIQAGQYLGNQTYPIMQVLAPDSKGCLPGDPDCDEPYGLVPVLHEWIN
jgi:hypothetical protein